jgi:hypothetical protein
MLHVTKEIQKDNTVYLECIFRNIQGLPVDTDSTPQYSILSESEKVIDQGYLVKRKDGYYGMYYTPDIIGVYNIKYVGSIDQKVVVLKSNFKVVSNTTSKS